MTTSGLVSSRPGLNLGTGICRDQTRECGRWICAALLHWNPNTRKSFSYPLSTWRCWVIFIITEWANNLCVSVYPRFSARHIQFQQATSVVHTTAWDNERLTNSFTLAHSGTQTQDHTNNHRLWTTLTTPCPTMLTLRPFETISSGNQANGSGKSLYNIYHTAAFFTDTRPRQSCLNPFHPGPSKLHFTIGFSLWEISFPNQAETRFHSCGYLPQSAGEEKHSDVDLNFVQLSSLPGQTYEIVIVPRGSEVAVPVGHTFLMS